MRSYSRVPFTPAERSRRLERSQPPVRCRGGDGASVRRRRSRRRRSLHRSASSAPPSRDRSGKAATHLLARSRDSTRIFRPGPCAVVIPRFPVGIVRGSPAPQAELRGASVSCPRRPAPLASEERRTHPLSESNAGARWFADVGEASSPPPMPVSSKRIRIRSAVSDG